MKLKPKLPTQVADIEALQQMTKDIIENDIMTKVQISHSIGISLMTLEKILKNDAETVELQDKTLTKIQDFVYKKLHKEGRAKSQTVSAKELDDTVTKVTRKIVKEEKEKRVKEHQKKVEFWTEFGKIAGYVPDNVRINIEIDKRK